MSMILCDYQAESRAAAQMADAAVSEMDRSDWLFLAFAWQALARSHSDNGDSLDPDLHTDAGAEIHTPQ